MSKFTVDLEQLNTVVGEIDAFAAAVEGALDRVNQRVVGLESSWSSGAAAMYQQTHSQWQRDAREAHAALVTLHSISSTARDNYLAAVTANRRMWSV